jgi:hypothetical protein
MRTHAEEDMDWEPLRAVLTDDAVGYWMWMGAAPAPDGSPVHCKHSRTRRYLRLDGEGRVYAEDASGMPVPLPGCGGATLVVILLLATASFDLDLGGRLTIPEAARRDRRLRGGS